LESQPLTLKTKARQMNLSVQELTNKIYQEGVEKAEKQGEVIIQESREKAISIVEAAEVKAREIIESAERHALEIKARNDAEMKLASRQVLGDLKQRITDLIIYKVSHPAVSNAMDDGAFIQNLISKIFNIWLEQMGKAEDLHLVLPAEEEHALEDFLTNSVSTLLQNGAKVSYDKKLGSGFQIIHEGDGFKIGFTDKDFENYFKMFSKSRLYNMLFGKTS